MGETDSKITQTNRSSVSEWTRIGLGGVLMGLANLVPGISGGTMLLAAGIYPRFINAVAEVTRFRMRFDAICVLAMVVASAALAVLLGAGVLKDLVIHHRWIMYSLFIGLTLGGIPAVWKLAGSLSPGLITAALIAFVFMVAMAALQHYQFVGSTRSNFLTLFLAGLAGAGAMILPGVSGGYLLLLMGQYVPILSAIDQVKDAISDGELATCIDPIVSVILPVGLGVITGIVVVGNLIQWLLRNYRRATLGFLLGLLLGSVAGLWPFRVGVEPEFGDRIKGRIVTAKNIQEFEPEDWRTVSFSPNPNLLAASLGLIVAGYAATWCLSKWGSGKDTEQENPTT